MSNRTAPAHREVFKHVTTEHVDRYRAMMGCFAAAKQRFVVHLRPEDVQAALAEADGGAPSIEDVGAALEQLREWGNLRADPDTARVTSVEDFNRARYLYQLTHAGEAAEEALAAYDAALGRRGALQAVALADIRERLEELARQSRAHQPDAGLTRQALRDLAAVFDGLADNAQAFMASLQRTIDLHEAEVEAFLAYKEQLVAYVERFVGELVTASAAIATTLDELDAAGVDRLLVVAAEAEAADASPDEADPVGARLAAWRDRWQGLRQWFVGTDAAPAQSQLLRRRARQAITALLGVVTELAERSSGRSDRAADFRELARWFAQAPTEADCHRLWRTAFGLAPARHLTVDADTLAERDEAPVGNATPWADAPPVRVSPRLRTTGRYERRGKPERVADRSAERRALAERLAEQSAQAEAARARLATEGTVRLSELGHLDRAAFGLLLDLLGEALTRPLVPGHPNEASTADGLLAIRLTPADDGRVAAIPTEDGELRGPDCHVAIQRVAPGRLSTTGLDGANAVATESASRAVASGASSPPTASPSAHAPREVAE
ncbi:TIGR02677 family protein [Egibacter rhizosphaerae]|uniref:TIGR02677 family protein n=1 Tax=Egibacter rhizosphaerae TaxID=1670831 RepID=UPI00197AE87A|nr:TIGR02677 family protein [Egibacter rhizosphaerae]